MLTNKTYLALLGHQPQLHSGRVGFVPEVYVHFCQLGQLGWHDRWFFVYNHARAVHDEFTSDQFVQTGSENHVGGFGAGSGDVLLDVYTVHERGVDGCNEVAGAEYDDI